MSYLTRVEIEWYDSGEKAVAVDPEQILNRAKVFVQEQEISEDVLIDLRTALEGSHNDGVGFNRMYSEGIVDMLSFVSLGFPSTAFYIRGTGEELSDMWLRAFENGRVFQSHGPWGDI